MIKNTVLFVVYIYLQLLNLSHASPTHFDERYLAWKLQQEAHDRQLLQRQQQPATVGGAPPSAASGVSKETPVVAQTAAVNSVVAPVTIHLNQATLQQLQQLKGVGEKKAQAIIEYREQHGPFKQIEELKKVKGIGESTLLKNQAQLAL